MFCFGSNRYLSLLKTLHFLEPLLQSNEVADEPPTLIKEDLVPLTAQVTNSTKLTRDLFMTHEC